MSVSKEMPAWPQLDNYIRTRVLCGVETKHFAGEQYFSDKAEAYAARLREAVALIEKIRGSGSWFYSELCFDEPIDGRQLLADIEAVLALIGPLPPPPEKG